MGIRFLDREIGKHAKKVVVSTVLLEGAHLRDQLSICSPEHGYETMVFLDGCTFFSLFTAKYKTRTEASRGHASTVRKLRSGKLPLAITIGCYFAWKD